MQLNIAVKALVLLSFINLFSFEAFGREEIDDIEAGFQDSKPLLSKQSYGTFEIQKLPEDIQTHVFSHAIESFSKISLVSKSFNKLNQPNLPHAILDHSHAYFAQHKDELLPQKAWVFKVLRALKKYENLDYLFQASGVIDRSFRNHLYRFIETADGYRYSPLFRGFNGPDRLTALARKYGLNDLIGRSPMGPSIFNDPVYLMGLSAVVLGACALTQAPHLIWFYRLRDERGKIFDGMNRNGILWYVRKHSNIPIPAVVGTDQPNWTSKPCITATSSKSGPFESEQLSDPVLIEQLVKSTASNVADVCNSLKANMTFVEEFLRTSLTSNQLKTFSTYFPEQHTDLHSALYSLPSNQTTWRVDAAQYELECLKDRLVEDFQGGRNLWIVATTIADIVGLFFFFGFIKYYH